MKKSLIALAVAGAFAAPAFAATSNVDVYGVLHVAIEDSDATDSDIQVTDHQSLIGFKGSEDLGGGLKAIWQIEQALSSNPASANGVGGNTLANRNSFVGLSGGFGTVLMGRHDTPYKMSTGKLDIFADTAADWNLGGVGMTHDALWQATFDITGDTDTADYVADTLFAGKGISTGYINATHDHRSPQALAYVSPEFSGFSFAGALILTNTAGNLDSGDAVDAYSLSANYSNGPLFVGVGYQDVDVIDSTAWKVGAGYTMGDLMVGAIYENNDIDIAGVTTETWGLLASYAMGPIVLKAEWLDLEVEDAEGTKWSIGADYNLSKRTKAYLVYTSDDADRVDYDGDDYVLTSDDVGTWAIGVKHSF